MFIFIFEYILSFFSSQDFQKHFRYVYGSVCIMTIKILWFWFWFWCPTDSECVPTWRPHIQCLCSAGCYKTSRMFLLSWRQRNDVSDESAALKLQRKNNFKIHQWQKVSPSSSSSPLWHHLTTSHQVVKHSDHITETESDCQPCTLLKCLWATPPLRLRIHTTAAAGRWEQPWAQHSQSFSSSFSVRARGKKVILFLSVSLSPHPALHKPSSGSRVSAGEQGSGVRSASQCRAAFTPSQVAEALCVYLGVKPAGKTVRTDSVILQTCQMLHINIFRHTVKKKILRWKTVELWQ